MTTSRTFLVNASTRHAVFVGRFAGSQIKEAIPYLERVRKVVLSRLSRVDVTQASRRQLTGVLSEIDSELEKIYTQMGRKLKSNMKSFADYEADFSSRMFTKATKADFTKPSKAAIEAAVFSDPLLLLDDSLAIDSALRQFSSAKRKQLTNVIKDGVVVGRTSDEIIRDVDFTIKKVQRNHAAALVRTITNHVSTAARQATIADNDDILDGVEWVSTLDGNTTHTCQALDRQTFKENEGPRPPIHWGCRSTVIPRVKDEYNLTNDIKTERPSVGPDGAEQVDSRTTYNSWLKKQPKSFQDEVLGPKKAKLYREGGLSVDKFVDDNYGPLTLDELRRKEPKAFEKAGLD